MSRFIKDELDKLLEFLSAYNAAKYVNDEDVKSRLTSINKQALSLLAWKIELKRKSVENTTYFEETISDIVQVIPLFVQGFYKAANCLLRSSCENFYKFFWEQYGDTPVDTFKSPDRLFEATRGIDLVAQNSILLQSFGTLRQLYSELSLYVHSAGENYCDFEEALLAFPKKDIEYMQVIAKLFQNYVKTINIIMCFCYKEVYFDMHHVNFQAITVNGKLKCTIFRH